MSNLAKMRAILLDLYTDDEINRLVGSKIKATTEKQIQADDIPKPTTLADLMGLDGATEAEAIQRAINPDPDSANNRRMARAASNRRYKKGVARHHGRIGGRRSPISHQVESLIIEILLQNPRLVGMSLTRRHEAIKNLLIKGGYARFIPSLPSARTIHNWVKDPRKNIVKQGS